MDNGVKKRIVIGTVLIVAIIVAVVMVVGSTSTAKSVTVAELTQGDYAGQKVQVEGNVVDNSYAITGKTVTFCIYDPNNAQAEPLDVSFEGAISATFGNGVTAICTGTVDADGTLQATELVTKCPSKYEDSTDALSISQLVGYGSSIVDKPVKVTGLLQPGSLEQQGTTKTFVLYEKSSDSVLTVSFQGAFGDDIDEDSALVITGSVDDTGAFTATDVSLEG